MARPEAVPNVLSGAAGAASRRLDRLGSGRFALVVFIPGAVLVGLFLLIPIASAVGMSLFRIQLAKDSLTPFIGLRNFTLLPADAGLLGAVPLTIAFSILTTAIVVPVSLATALFLDRNARLIGVLGVLMLLPWAVAPIVTGTYWRFIFQSQFGLMTALANLVGLADGPVDWLGDPTTAVVIAAMASAWRVVPLFTLIILAALKSIPRAQYAASKVDGADAWQRFRFVTLPALRATLLIVAVLSVISTLQVFDVLYTLTRGGPGTSTTVVIYHIFKTAFEQLNLGYASAMALFLTGIIALCTLFLVVFRRRRGRVTSRADAPFDEQFRVGDLAAALAAARAESPSPNPRVRINVPSWVGRLTLIVGGILLLVWSLGPIAWMALASVQPESAVTSIPFALTFDLRISNYTDLFLNTGRFQSLRWLDGLWVSLQVATLTALLTVALSALIAYPIARLRIPGKGIVLGVLLATQMVPAMVLAIPVLVIFQRLDLVDTVTGLVLVNTAFSIPVAVWLLKNVFDQAPKSLEAAARLDGCTRLGSLFRVVIPACRAGIAATAILILIGTWNEFLFAVVLGNNDAVTATRLIGLIQTGTGPSGAPPYTLLAAAGLVATLPCIVLVALFHRRISGGLAEGYATG